MQAGQALAPVAKLASAPPWAGPAERPSDDGHGQGVAIVETAMAEALDTKKFRSQTMGSATAAYDKEQ